MARVLSAKRAMRKALVLSIGLHAGLFGLARPLILHPAAAAPVPVSADETDHWTGTTAELPGGAQAGGIYDVALDPPAAPPAADPAPPEAPTPPHAPPAEHTATTPAPAADPKASPPRPRPKPAPRGERTAKREASSSSASEGDRAGAGGPGTFGAEGPSSVRDLRRAFVRAIPVACKEDPIWAKVPLGDSGKLEVEIHVDESGHITRAEPRGENRPQALVQLLRRTLPLIDSGTFAVRKGQVSEGTEILTIRATVSQVEGAKDELGHDARYEFAEFTQPTGRHVEVTVKVLRVDPR
jgi:outer membrane biosynthesis protein TonB